MKKSKEKGFMLVETLVVTTFIAGVFIFLFIQFSTLNKGYKTSFKYDTVEGTYALNDIVNYLNINDDIKTNIVMQLSNNNYVKINNCSSLIFSNTEYCDELFELEDIKEAVIIEKDYDFVEKDNVLEDIKEYKNKVNKRNIDDIDYLIIIELNNGNIVSKYIEL